MWKKVPNTNLMVNERGDVITTGGLRRKPRMNRNGYFDLSVTVGGVRKQLEIHRLVAKAFLPIVEGKNQVNHINEVKTDNSVSNLEWCTAGENVRQSVRSGRRPKQVRRVLTKVERINIRHINHEISHNMLSKLYDVDRRTIARICGKED